jgi:ABC-type Na+ efflux pump permease subunit
MASARNWGWVIRILQIVLAPLLAAITPMIRDLFEDSLDKLLEKARSTDNPIDDLFVEFLFNILDMPIPPDEV